MKSEPTFRATIHVGLKVRTTGYIHSLETAARLCQQFVDENSDCVSFTPTTYIYKGGNEPGVIIEFIQYPRFPRPESEIVDRALALAQTLMLKLTQFKVSVLCNDTTYMLENDTIDAVDTLTPTTL